MAAVLMVFYYLYSYYLMPQWGETFRAIGTFNYGSLIPGEIVEEVGNAPLIFFWIILAVFVFGIYYIFSGSWETIKELVSLEVMEVEGDIDDYNRYRFRQIATRTVLVLLSFLPFLIGFVVILPWSGELASYVFSLLTISNLFLKQLVSLFPGVVLWTVYILVNIILFKLVSYSENEVELEREHSAVLESEEKEAEEDCEEV